MEGVTFHTPKLAKELRSGFIEARLHMDADNNPNVDPAKLKEHRLLQAQLTGTLAMPQYAVIDPVTGEFLARHRLRGSVTEAATGWVDDFLKVFRVVQG